MLVIMTLGEKRQNHGDLETLLVPGVTTVSTTTITTSRHRFSVLSFI